MEKLVEHHFGYFKEVKAAAEKRTNERNNDCKNYYSQAKQESLLHIRQEVPRAFQFMLSIKLIKRVASKSSFNNVNIGILTVVLMHLQRSTHHEVQQKI